MLRWCDCVRRAARTLLRIESELGTSWQAQLVLGALPERCEFPGARAELMFAPPEELPFAVDLSLNARFLPNELALRIARRRIQDADQIVRAESDGEQGVTDRGYERTQEARDLLATCRRRAARRCCARRSRSRSARDERASSSGASRCAARVRRGPAAPPARRPAAAVPAAPSRRSAPRVAGYDDMLTAEQVAAMMPTATHAVGSRSGFYLGHTLTRLATAGALQPARGLRQRPQHDDPQRRRARLGQDDARPEAQVRGLPAGRARDRLRPEGRSSLSPARGRRAAQSSASTLRPDPALRGMLDPLRVAPEHLRQDAAVSFLRDLLPARAEPAWETARRRGGRPRARRAPRRRPACEVVRALREGDAIDAQVGRTLEVYARSGLTQLGFADPAVSAAGRRARAGHLPADPRPAGARAGHAARRVLAGRARRRADRAPDRDVRDAPDGRRARAPEAVLLRRGLAPARRSGRARRCSRRCSGWVARSSRCRSSARSSSPTR